MSEIKQLPFTLAKLAGAAMAVIGIPGVIIILTRKPNPSFSELLPYLLLGIAGIVIFVISSKMLSKRKKENRDPAPLPKVRRQMSILAWSILLALMAIFLLITYIVTV